MKENTILLPRRVPQAIPLLKAVLYVKQKQYECLLVSFLVLIFGNTFTLHNHITGAFIIYQNMIIGALVFYNKKHLRAAIILLLAASVVLDVFAPDLHFMDARSWHGIIYLVFFFLVSVQVYQKVLYTKTVTREMLSAALCGFVLLCLIGTFLFYQVDVEVPHSFANAGEGRDILTNLNYFSFTTLLTVGYGDITPVSIFAKRAVMLIGLAGHFYTVFITSIIIGKYLAASKGGG